MKQWMIPVATLLVGAGIAGGATLGVTRPWQPEEGIPVSTPAPQAAFTADDILVLTQQQLGSGTVSWPTGARSVRCLRAVFRPDADMWVVTCLFYPDQAGVGGATFQTNIYTVSDKDGKLVQ